MYVDLFLEGNYIFINRFCILDKNSFVRLYFLEKYKVFDGGWG